MFKRSKILQIISISALKLKVNNKNNALIQYVTDNYSALKVNLGLSLSYSPDCRTVLNPTKLLFHPGEPMARLADLSSSTLSSQLPPLMTRALPEAGPLGLKRESAL